LTSEDGSGLTRVAWQRDVPESIRSLGGLANPDYQDLFTATTNEVAEKSAEDWARAVLDRAPYYIRLGVFHVGWRLFLGMRLGPRRSPNYIAGLKIAARGADWVRLEAASWMMTVALVFKADEARLSWASFARYDRRVAALVFSPGSIVHRKAGFVLMRRALNPSLRVSRDGLP
jgi:hypothetical protein